MYNNKGQLQTEDTEILKICHSFYSDLYGRTQQPYDSPYTFIPSRDDNMKLKSDEVDVLGEEITLEELFATLKGMKKGKSPGLDGLTVEFYSKFWNEVGSLVYNSLIFCKGRDRLSAEHRRGVVKLIPKKYKNPAFVHNLRPITLLNVDVKLLTRLLANRLKLVLDRLISDDQQAFVKGRYLGNNILDLYSMASRALEEDQDFLVMSLDIEKAFDTVQWPFLYKLLHSWGFPSSFIEWIQLMNFRKELRVYNNGHSSEPIPVQNGLAQGCSLSPLLFILCIESLARVVRENTAIKGLKYEGGEKKISLVADDTLLVVEATIPVLQEVVKVLNEFEKCLGLKVNYNKSIICCVGRNKQNLSMHINQEFVWASQGDVLSYLGLSFTQNDRNEFIEAGNFDTQQYKIRNDIKSLRYQHRSMLGRILIVKTMLASLFVYKLTLLQSPMVAMMKNLDKEFYSYVWNNSFHKVAKNTMIMDTKDGGFKMLSVYLQEKSLKFRWLQRLVQDDNNCFWKFHVLSCLDIDVKLMLSMNLTRCTWRRFIKKDAVLPTFWKDVFNLWFSTTTIRPFKTEPDPSELLQRHIWHCMGLNQTTVCSKDCLKELEQMGILTVEDFIRKKHLFPNNEYIQILRRQMPLIWQWINPDDVTLEQTLHFGVLNQKWTAKVIYLRLRDMEIRNYTPRAKITWKYFLKIDNVPELWEQSCKKLSSITDMRLRAFHLMFINKGFFCNDRVSKFKNISPNCSFCHQEVETMLHLYWECTYVQPVIQQLKGWFDDLMEIPPEEFTRESFLFSLFSNTAARVVSLIFKRYILINNINASQGITFSISIVAFGRTLYKYIHADF